MTTKNNQLTEKPAPKKVGMTAKSLFDRDDVRNDFMICWGEGRPPVYDVGLTGSGQQWPTSKGRSQWPYINPLRWLRRLIYRWIITSGSLILSHITRQKDGSYKTVAQFQIGYKGFHSVGIWIRSIQTNWGLCKGVWKRYKFWMFTTDWPPF